MPVLETCPDTNSDPVYQPLHSGGWRLLGWECLYLRLLSPRVWRCLFFQFVLLWMGKQIKAIDQLQLESTYPLPLSARGQTHSDYPIHTARFHLHGVSGVHAA